MSKYLHAKKMKNERERLRLSQIKLAKEAGVSRYRIHLHENDLTPLSSKDMLKIIKVTQRMKRNYFKGEK